VYIYIIVHQGVIKLSNRCTSILISSINIFINTRIHNKMNFTVYSFLFFYFFLCKKKKLIMKNVLKQEISGRPAKIKNSYSGLSSLVDRLLFTPWKGSKSNLGSFLKMYIYTIRQIFTFHGSFARTMNKGIFCTFFRQKGNE
jgi:hypothetical protein